MTINYQSGAKRYKVETPTRKQLIKKYARRRYRSTVSLLTNNDSMFDHVLDSVVKNIKTELKMIGSLQHNSILRDTIEAVRQFSWETIWLELKIMSQSLQNSLLNYFLKLESHYFVS